MPRLAASSRRRCSSGPTPTMAYRRRREFMGELRDCFDNDILSLVWNEPGDGDDQRILSGSPDRPKPAGVAAGWKKSGSVPRSKTPTGGVEVIPRARIASSSERCPPMPTWQRFHSLAPKIRRAPTVSGLSGSGLHFQQQITAVHVDEVGDSARDMGERDGVADGADVPKVNHVDIPRSVGVQPPGPAQLVREKLCLGERKRLPVDAIRLGGIELCGIRRGDRGHLHRVAGRAKPAGKLDVPARHSTKVRRVVLRHE